MPLGELAAAGNEPEGATTAELPAPLEAQPAAPTASDITTPTTSDRIELTST